MHLSEPPIIYLDTNVFIGYMKQEEDKISDVKKLVNRTEEKKIILITSPFTLTEAWQCNGVECHKYYNGNKIFFKHEFRRIYIMDIEIGVLTQKLQNERKVKGYKLSYKDSIHVATALVAKADVLLTYDGTSEDNKKKDPLLELDDTFKYPLIDGRKLRIKTPSDFLLYLDEQEHSKTIERAQKKINETEQAMLFDENENENPKSETSQ
ncbi:MAG: PIN domain-containing protein [Candidatus Omnitrophica bacterium]|nr:PIN domain-containing protein [Candidatus Omnitrophota bacterium]